MTGAPPQKAEFPWIDYIPDSVAPVMQYLIGPVALNEFLNEFWARRPLYVPGRAGKFRGLFSMERLSEHLGASLDRSRGSPAQPLRVRASYDHGITHIDASLADAITYYDRGATLCVEGLDAHDQHLAALATTVKRELNFLGTTDIRAYLSPDKQGFENHFDVRIATTLQIEGQKRWRYSEDTAVVWPYLQVPAGFGPASLLQPGEMCRPLDECTFHEVILKPGDVLCLPAGCWHSAEAIGHSLALNLAFSGFGSFWGPVLMSVLSTSPVLRAPAPPAVFGGSPASFPQSVDGFLEAGINELIDVFTGLRENSEPLRQRWRALREALGSSDTTPQ